MEHLDKIIEMIRYMYISDCTDIDEVIEKAILTVKQKEVE